jgi:hypothetical protein
MKTFVNIRWLSVLVLLVSVIAFGASPTQVAVADDEWRVGTYFFGVINTLPNTPGFIGDWRVNNTIVHVTAGTFINQARGAVAVGALVAVQGWPLADGSVDGTYIDVVAGVGDKVKLFGVVKTLPGSPNLVGDWTVQVPVNQMVTIHVASTTTIDETKGKVVIGAFVKIEGTLKSDNSVDATLVSVVFIPQGVGRSVTFLGKIESLPGGGLIGEWDVSGIKVNVSAATTVDQTRATAQVGAFVQVKGVLQTNGSVNATEIIVRAAPPPPPTNKYIKFYGVVQSLPASGVIGTWVVSGRQVNVTIQTQIVNGPARVGSIVEVKGYLQTNGSIIAAQIVVRGTSGSSNAPFGQSGAMGGK